MALGILIRSPYTHFLSTYSKWCYSIEAVGTVGSGGLYSAGPSALFGGHAGRGEGRDVTGLGFGVGGLGSRI